MGAEYYDAIAPGYDELHGEEQKRKARIILDTVIINPEMSLLDVGCGTGQATSLFPCKKVGIDPSAELLKKATFPVVKGVAESLPFADNSFDVVISLTAIHHFTDIKKALNEMRRVSKDVIVITVLKKAKKFQEIVSAIEEIYTVKKRVGDMHDSIFFLQKV